MSASLIGSTIFNVTVTVGTYENAFVDFRANALPAPLTNALPSFFGVWVYMVKVKDIHWCIRISESASDAFTTLVYNGFFF